MVYHAMSFCYTVTTQKSINDAIVNLTHNLKEIGFGVLEVLDFKKILNEKNQEFQNEYKLMEVCNPKLAKQVLDSNPDLGLLLPCTIAVYQKNKQNCVSLAKPTSLLKMASEEHMQFVGNEIEKNLIEIIEKSK